MCGSRKACDCICKEMLLLKQLELLHSKYMWFTNIWMCTIIIIVIRILRNGNGYMKLCTVPNQFNISTVGGQGRIFLHITVIKFLFCICSIKCLMKFKADWQYGHWNAWKGWRGKKMQQVIFPTILIVMVSLHK